MRSNIARLQNDRQPTVRAANKQLQSVIRGISNIDAGEGRPKPDPYHSNIFWKATQIGTQSGTQNIFAPLPARATISLAQYKQGIRSTASVEAGQDDSVIFGAAAFEANEAIRLEASPSAETDPLEVSSAPTSPSQGVPLEDLNISSGELFDEVLSEADSIPSPITTSTPLISPLTSATSNSSFNEAVPDLISDSLPEHLFDSELDDCSSELDIGLNTEDELLNSDPEDNPRAHSTPHKRTEAKEVEVEVSEPIDLTIRLDLSRIDLRVILDTIRAKKATVDLQTPAKPVKKVPNLNESPIHPPFDLTLPDADDTDTEDIGRPTPSKSYGIQYLIKLPRRTQNRRRLERSMRDAATAAYIAHKANAREETPIVCDDPNPRVVRRLFDP